MKTSLLAVAAAALLCAPGAKAYTPGQGRPRPPTATLSRRRFGLIAGSAAIGASLPPPPAAVAFEGTGSSAYSGRSPSTKAAIRKSYQDRVAADVRDFNALGAALSVGGTTDSDAWVFFFNPYQRRSADDVGRTYAALADFVGHKVDGGKLEGGGGYLLAATFAKQGKPPDNAPAVKSYNALFKALEPIEAAGKKGNAAKARAAWEKAAALFPKYLEDVEMPGSLDDPLYR